MNLMVNGRVHEHGGAGTVISLIEELNARPEHTAVMLNGAVVPAAAWSAAKLVENDAVELLVFVGGG